MPQLGTLANNEFREPRARFGIPASLLTRFQTRQSLQLDLANERNRQSLFAKRMLSQHAQYMTRARLLQFWRCSKYSPASHITAPGRPFSSLARRSAKPRAPHSIGIRCYHASPRRDARKKTTLNVDTLPQGPIEGDPLPPQDDSLPEYPPLLQEVRNNMLKFSHCVLVTRVGGFYEVCSHSLRSNLAYSTSCISSMPTSLLHS